jgi:hypothetical protein
MPRAPSMPRQQPKYRRLRRPIKLCRRGPRTAQIVRSSSPERLQHSRRVHQLGRLVQPLLEEGVGERRKRSLDADARHRRTRTWLRAVGLPHHAGRTTGAYAALMAKGAHAGPRVQAARLGPWTKIGWHCSFGPRAASHPLCNDAIVVP